MSLMLRGACDTRRVRDRRLDDVTVEILTEDYDERRAHDVAALRAIVAEAVIRQDAAEALLAEIRGRGPLSELAPRGGVIVSRFTALRRDLPVCVDRALQARAIEVGELLDHHAMLVSSALDLLSVDWRSERMVQQLERLDGLGPPAARLDAIWAELQATRP
jgi:hypothetical protein